jgi:outer membrane protein OmpA-like peptidoglycan-associated protein
MRPLRVIGPCRESWDAMRGAGRVRRCEACASDVHDLSRMTEPEALAYVLKRGGRLCTRAPAADNGEIILAAGRARPPGRGAALLAATLGAAVAACGGGSVVAAPTESPAHVPMRPGAPRPPVDSLAATDPPPAAVPSGDADQDADGIPDATDACPADPGQPSADPNRNGCPQVVMIMSTGITILQEVLFTAGSTRPTRDADPIVRATADALKADPSITKLEVGGHAATDDPNPQRTSEARANEVIARLVAIGVDRSRLVAKGYGTTHPLAPNSTADGRAHNRRVEFLVVATHP